MVMKHTNVSTFKAKLSEFLRLVKKGEIVRITDRNAAIADVVPVSKELVVVEAENSPQKFWSNRTLKGKGRTDAAAMIIEDRSKR